MNKIIIMLVMLLLLAPVSFSNGGCTTIADDVLVQMSHAPHTPKVNEKTSFLFSFGNNKGLISREINGQLRVMKGEDIILAKDFQIEDGILDLKHEFKNVGLYEIYIDFRLQNKTYSPEGFVIEVIEDNKPNYLNNVILLIAGFLTGILSLKFIERKK